MVFRFAVAHAHALLPSPLHFPFDFSFQDLESPGWWAMVGSRLAMGVGFVLRFAEDKLTNAETYRMPSIIVH